MTPNSNSPTETLALVQAVLDDSIPFDVLKERPGDGLVARTHPGSDHSVIVKLWNRPGVRGFLRTLTRTSNLYREMNATAGLRGAGIRVPAVLGSCRIPDAGSAYTEALLFEDLGHCTTTYDHVHVLIEEGREQELQLLLDEIIDTTSKIVDAKMTDWDHCFYNIIITPSGEIARLDFEVARNWPPLLSPRNYPRMLGWLISTYAFAAQPEVERVTEFATALTERLDPPRWVLWRTTAWINFIMDYQYRATGIRTTVPLPWAK